MSTLSKIDSLFLEDPSRMKMGKGNLAKRWKVTEDEIEKSRSRVKKILSARDLVEELDRHNYQGSIKDTAKTIIADSAGKALDFKMDVLSRQFKSKLKDSEEKYNNLLLSYEELDSKYDEALRLTDFKPLIEIPVLPEYSRQGASIVHLGDWHVEKRIDNKAVNGFNEFNPDIAKKRAQTCADSVVKLINRDVTDFDTHETVIYLTGDFIEGYIHPEAQQVTNYMTPIEASAFATELLANTIKHIEDNSSTSKISVICKTGNHSRTSRRMESSLDHRTNYETMIYAFLAQRFPHIEFSLPTSDIGYTNILGKRIRDFHGWQVSYGGGIGGLTIPLTKFIQRQNQNDKADYNLMGHFHQCSMPTKDSQMTGSLCGFDSYAQSIGAAKEPALQAYRLIDSKYGLLGFNPIICEK